MSMKKPLSDRSPAVIYVSPRGIARCTCPWGRAGLIRQEAERARCADVMSRATPPGRVSPVIPVAPARGPAIAEVPRAAVMTEAGPRDRRSAPVGFDRVRVGDAFDLMDDQARRGWPRVVDAARRAHEAAQAQPGARQRDFVPPAFQPPFSAGQVAAARDYAALVERVNGSGVKCASLEGRAGGGGGGCGVSEAVARDMARLAVLRRRIGDGLAKDCVRPSKGGMRTAIRVRDLVDRVCIGGATLSDVLAAHGWGRNAGVQRVLQEALRRALDRMQGYDLVRPQNVA
jgi:hypothetical protein